MVINLVLSWVTVILNHSLTLQVFMPNTEYNGQKLIKLVINNTPDITKRTMAKVPSITFK